MPSFTLPKGTSLFEWSKKLGLSQEELQENLVDDSIDIHQTLIQDTSFEFKNSLLKKNNQKRLVSFKIPEGPTKAKGLSSSMALSLEYINKIKSKYKLKQESAAEEDYLLESVMRNFNSGSLQGLEFCREICKTLMSSPKSDTRAKAYAFFALSQCVELILFKAEIPLQNIQGYVHLALAADPNEALPHVAHGLFRALSLENSKKEVVEIQGHFERALELESDNIFIWTFFCYFLKVCSPQLENTQLIIEHSLKLQIEKNKYSSFLLYFLQKWAIPLPKNINFNKLFPESSIL